MAYGIRVVASAVIAVVGLLNGDPVGVLLGVALFAIGEYSMRVQLRSSVGELTFVATEDDWSVTSERGTNTRSWSSFQSARRRMGFWVLAVNRAASQGVPMGAFDAAQAETFEALLRRKQLLP